MMPRLVTITGLIVLVGVVIAIESAVGVPLAGVALALIIARSLPSQIRVGWLGVVGIIIAAVLNTPLSLTALSMLGGWWLWFITRRLVASQTLRLIIVASVVSGVLFSMTSMPWTVASTILVGLSLMITTIMAVTIWRTRYVTR